MKKFLLMIAILGASHPAFAELQVMPAQVRSGFFQSPDCTPAAAPQQFNECLCEADIRKAQITGIDASVAAVMNKQLAIVPEQLASESCQGTPTAAPAGEGAVTNVNAAKAAFETVFQSPSVLTVLVTYSTYGAGAAHPLDGTEGFTFDLKTGKLIEPSRLLTPAQLVQANAFIQKELAKKYSDKLFDEIKTRDDPFLAETGCDTCTLFYGKDGWTIRFQLYAIAPFAAGELEINVPAEIIPAPETLISKS
jgi:hypothetical protein